jgi:hypothetical protein
MEPFDPVTQPAAVDPDAAHTGDPRPRDLSISLERANVVALVLFPVLLVVTLLPFWAIHGGAALADGASVVFIPWVFFPAILVAIVVHEGLHAVGFLVAGAPRGALHFGVDRKTLSPYAGCRTPVRADAYRLSVLLPGLVLGVLPWIYGMVAGAGWAVVWAALMILTAGGDAMILWIIRGLHGATLVLDHPTRAGCLIVEEPRQDVPGPG